MGIFHVVIGAEQAVAKAQQRHLEAGAVRLGFDYDPPASFAPQVGIRATFHPAATYFQPADEFAHVEDLAGTAKSLTLLHGHCFERGSTRSRYSVAELHALLRQPGVDIEALRTHLGGEYVIVHLGPGGRLVAFNDLVGLEQIYYRSTPDLVEVSNSPAVLERSGDRKHDFDFATTLSQPLHCFADLGGSYIKSIHRLRQDHFLEVVRGELSIRRLPPHFYNFGRIDDVGPGGSVDELFELGLEEVTSWLKVATKDIETIRLGITGGKDSRAVLSLCLLAGLGDKLQLFTRGDPNNPEVQIGATIAAKYELPHENPPMPEPPGQVDYFRRIAVHVFQSHALSTPWDLLYSGQVAERPALNLAGTCGEFLRPFKPAFAGLAGAYPGASVTPYFDPLGVFSDGFKREASERLIEHLRSFERYGASERDLANVYHIANSYTGWLGSIQQAQAHTNTVVKPLHSYHWTNLAFAIPPEVRSAEVVHYSIVERFDPTLLEVPFFVQRWSPDLASFGKSRGLDVEPVPPVKDVPVFGSWQYQFNQSVAVRDEAAAILDTTSDSQVWEYVDIDRFRAEAARDNHGLPTLHSLLGVFGVLFKHERIELPRKGYRPGRLESDRAPVILRSGPLEPRYMYHQVHPNDDFGVQPATRRELLDRPPRLWVHRYAVQLARGGTAQALVETRSKVSRRMQAAERLMLNAPAIKTAARRSLSALKQRTPPTVKRMVGPRLRALVRRMDLLLC